MADTRHKDGNWSVGNKITGKVETWERVQVAVLMDIRDELKRANETLDDLRRLANCRNVRLGFIAMQNAVKHLRKHGAKPLPAKPAKKKAKRK